jgi:N-acetylglutamate synthase-like GNAT family acetyltransferase
MKIELATLEDAERLWEVQKAAFYEYIEKYGHFEDNPYDMTFDRIKFNINYHLGKYYKIIKDDQIIGGVFGFLLDRDDMMKIAQFYLLPDYQAQHLGEEALKYVLDIHQEIKVWVVDTIYQETRNIHFYEKLGFQMVDVEAVDEDLSFATLIYKR